MDIHAVQPFFGLGLQRFRLGALFRSQAVAVEHVQEIRVAPDVQLVGPFQLDSPVLEKVRQDAVYDGRPYLGFDVVADEREPVFLETLRPQRIAGDENGHVVDEAGSGLKGAFRVKLRSGFRSYRKIIQQDFGPGITQDADNGLTRGLLFAGRLERDLFIVFLHVRGKAVQNASHRYGDVPAGNIALKYGRAVGMLKYRFRNVFSDFSFVDVECSGNLYIERLVSSDVPVHQTDGVFSRSGPVVFDTLNQRRSTIPDTGDCDPDLPH